MALIDNLESSWELTEASGNATDSRGTNTLTDNNTVTSGTGLVNATARQFTRANSEFLNIADNSSVRMGDIDATFEVWFNAATLPGAFTERSLVAKDTTVAGNRDYQLDYNGSGSVRWYINGGSVLVEWGSALSTSTWYQVIAKHDSVNNLLILKVNNGTAVTANTSGAVPQTSAAQFRLGARDATGSENFWDGLIGPVRYWKRVTSDAEDTELWNSGAGRTYSYIAGSPPPPPPPPPTGVFRSRIAGGFVMAGN